MTHTRFPIVQDINWHCPTCQRDTMARMVAYPDQVSITCAVNGAHRFTYHSQDEIPGWTSYQKPGKDSSWGKIE